MIWKSGSEWVLRDNSVSTFSDFTMTTLEQITSSLNPQADQIVIGVNWSGDIQDPKFRVTLSQPINIEKDNPKWWWSIQNELVEKARYFFITEATNSPRVCQLVEELKPLEGENLNFGAWEDEKYIPQFLLDALDFGETIEEAMWLSLIHI